MKDRGSRIKIKRTVLTTEGFPVLYPVAVTWMRQRDHKHLRERGIAADLRACSPGSSSRPHLPGHGRSRDEGERRRLRRLPTELDTETPPPQITYVYAADEKTLLATFYDENRHDIERGRTADHAGCHPRGQEFYKHKGVDLQGIVRAFVANQRGTSTQGASTRPCSTCGSRSRTRRRARRR